MTGRVFDMGCEVLFWVLLLALALVGGLEAKELLQATDAPDPEPDEWDRLPPEDREFLRRYFK